MVTLWSWKFYWEDTDDVTGPVHPIPFHMIKSLKQSSTSHRDTPYYIWRSDIVGRLVLRMWIITSVTWSDRSSAKSVKYTRHHQSQKTVTVKIRWAIIWKVQQSRQRNWYWVQTIWNILWRSQCTLICFFLIWVGEPFAHVNRSTLNFHDIGIDL